LKHTGIYRQTQKFNAIQHSDTCFGLSKPSSGNFIANVKELRPYKVHTLTNALFVERDKVWSSLTL